jgi:hypothetical protein
MGFHNIETFGFDINQELPGLLPLPSLLAGFGDRSSVAFSGEIRFLVWPRPILSLEANLYFKDIAMALALGSVSDFSMFYGLGCGYSFAFH